MSYKNDSNLVIANRFSDASGKAKAQLWETYDRLRDLTVSGSGTGTGFESAGGFLYNIASLLAPSAFATVFGGSETMNIAGTSYYSGVNGKSAYGVDSMYNYSGFPSGAASINSIYGLATGGASSAGSEGKNGFRNLFKTERYQKGDTEAVGEAGDYNPCSTLHEGDRQNSDYYLEAF